MNGIAKWIDCHCSNKSEAGSNSLLYSPLIEVFLVPQDEHGQQSLINGRCMNK